MTSKGMRLAVFMGTLVYVGMAPKLIAEPDNTTYQVTVVSSFGTVFTDCYRFDTPASGSLRIDALGQTITFRHGQLNTVGQRFKAVSRSGQPLAIMFMGEAVVALSQLNGEAVNEFGDTFVFTGFVNASCSLTLVPSNPYSNGN